MYECSCSTTECCCPNESSNLIHCKCFKCNCTTVKINSDLGYEILTLALKPQRLYASTHTAAECNKTTILLCRKKREQILEEIIRVTRDVETVSSFISSKDNGHREIIYVDFVFKNPALKSQLLICLKASHYMIIPYQKDEEISYINAPLLGNKPELSLFMEEYDMKSTISIQGMTCSSCISIIEDNIRKLNGIDVNSASVSLFPPRLTVEHSTEMVTAFDIMNQIQQMGFECELIKTEPLVKSINSQKSEMLKVFINGMTCTSCSHGISQCLTERDGIINVDINLVTNIGTIEYQPARVGIRDILQLIENMGFDVALYKQNEHAVESKQTFSRDALICLIFVIPAFFIEMIFMMAVPDWEISGFFMQEICPGINLDDIIMLILATPVQFILGFRFYKGAYKTFRYLRSANMDTLVAMGTLAAYLFSIYSMIENFLLGKKESDQFFETVIFLIFFILIGKYLEHCAKGKTTNAVKELYDLTPDTAELVILDSFQCILTQKKIPLELVQMGDFLKVSAGSKIPCDGVVLQGSTYIDESMITGESLPVHKDRGSRIIGGTVNLNGPLIMKVLAVGSESTLTRIINLMQDAQSNRAPIQEIADKVSKVFVPTVILISCITFIVWIAIFSIGIVLPSYLPRGKSILNFAVEHAVAVLVIACPCALGLATPTAIMVGSGIAAKYGILIKGGGAAMEYSSKIKTVVFDKTGTLTMGKPKVSEFIFTDLLQGIDQSCFWKLVSSIESASDHPLAKAVVEFIEQMNLEPNLLEPGYSVNNISETGGRGLLGKFGEKNEHSIFVGNQEWMLDNGISINEYQHKIDSWTMLGKSIVLIGIEMNSEKQTKFIAGLLSISDIIRPESRAVVEELKNMGIDVWMITGDHENTAKAVAEAVGIFPLNILSHVLPEEKYERIKELQSKCRLNEKVAMVGDGINDSVAIAQADVGIAIGTGSDIAIEAADVILVKSTLFDVITLIDLSRIVIKRIKLNFLWAFGFNFCGIPLAAGMFFCFGVELAPWIAGLAMAFSSVSVVCSSLLLNTYKAPRI